MIVGDERLTGVWCVAGANVAIATASRNLGEGYAVALNINGIRVSTVGAADGGVSIGKSTRYMVWTLTDVRDGEYYVDAVVVDPDGNDVTVQDSLAFGVRRGDAERMSEGLRWHCERFLGPQVCR